MIEDPIPSPVICFPACSRSISGSIWSKCSIPIPRRRNARFQMRGVLSIPGYDQVMLRSTAELFAGSGSVSQDEQKEARRRRTVAKRAPACRLPAGVFKATPPAGEDVHGMKGIPTRTLSRLWVER